MAEEPAAGRGAAPEHVADGVLAQRGGDRADRRGVGPGGAGAGLLLRAAVLAGALFGLGTIAWPYATHFFGEPVSTLAIFGLFYTLLRLRQTGVPRYAVAGRAGGRHHDHHFGRARGAAGAVWRLSALGGSRVGKTQGGGRQTAGSTPRSAICDLLFARLLAFAVPLAALAGLLVLYNLVRFGTLLSTGYHFESGEGFNANWLLGLWGLLFSPYRGLFWYTPLAILSVLAWPGFIRRHRAEGWLAAIITDDHGGDVRQVVDVVGRVRLGAALPRAAVALPCGRARAVAGVQPGPRGVAGVRRVLLIIVLALSSSCKLLAVTANYVNYEIALRGLYPTDWADPLKYGPPRCSTRRTARCWGRPACCWRTSTPTSTWAGSGRAMSRGKCRRWPAASRCWPG